MMLEKLCLLSLCLQEIIIGKSILTDSDITVYTTEGSSLKLTFKYILINMTYSYNINLKNISFVLTISPNVIETQKINVTASDTGHYWLCNNHRHNVTNEFIIRNMSDQFRTSKQMCAMERSTENHSYKTDLSLCQNEKEVDYLMRKNFRNVGTFTIHAKLTPVCKGVFPKDISYYYTGVVLKVAKLWFINQTGSNTLVGQEGIEMEINCFSNTEQFITALKLESNNSIKAVGDNQSVSYTFKPDRTDHLTKYKCVDSTELSIMVEVRLIIMYAPAVTVRYTNSTVECDCDGNPAIYNVYRLDQMSKYGELVRSNNLDNGTFTFQNASFPYQRNGRYICVVSNGIPDTNGDILQTSSTNVKYEGPPVFAKENRYVKIGRVGKSSMTLSFHVYSYPDVEEIFLDKLGRVPVKKVKIRKYVLKSTPIYIGFDNHIEIQGFDILIESEELDIGDFQAYCITVKNRLGASDYHFEIIKKEDCVLCHRKEKDFVTLCVVGAVLFGSIIVNVGFCVYYIRTRVPRHDNVLEDHDYHTYEEIRTLSYRIVRNLFSSEINHIQVENLTEHVTDILAGANLQSTNDGINELNADFLHYGLQQQEIPEVDGQSISISFNDTNLSGIVLSQIPSTSMTNIASSSDDGTSNNVMVGNVGDGYENQYETVLQYRSEIQPYTEIIGERQNSISSTNSNINEDQRLETDSTKEPIYINLQF